MGKKFFWTAAALLFAANVAVFKAPVHAASGTMDVRQCACIYGGDPDGPVGPGEATCMVWFRFGCEDVGDCKECEPIET